jgi:hypothetical protein
MLPSPALRFPWEILPTRGQPIKMLPSPALRFPWEILPTRGQPIKMLPSPSLRFPWEILFLPGRPAYENASFSSLEVSIETPPPPPPPPCNRKLPPPKLWPRQGGGLIHMDKPPSWAPSSCREVSFTLSFHTLYNGLQGSQGQISLHGYFNLHSLEVFSGFFISWWANLQPR